MSSPIDDLFFNLYGYRPTKDGKSLELLLAAALKLLNPEHDVGHDDHIRGAISGTDYQLDATQNTGTQTNSAEAKDYTLRGRPVGRPDVQKLAGALPDVNLGDGILASATGFTKPAIKYAEKAQEIIGKQISLMELRPVVEEDMEGRIQEIHVKIHIQVPDYANASFSPVLTSEGERKIAALSARGLLSDGGVSIGEIFNQDGSICATIEEVTRKGFGVTESSGAEGTFWFPKGCLKIAETLLPLRGITYNVPFLTETREIVIKGDGTATLIAKSVDGSVDKVLRDTDLRRVRFEDDGTVNLVPR